MATCDIKPGYFVRAWEANFFWSCSHLQPLFWIYLQSPKSEMSTRTMANCRVSLKKNSRTVHNFDCWPCMLLTMTLYIQVMYIHISDITWTRENTCLEILFVPKCNCTSKSQCLILFQVRHDSDLHNIFWRQISLDWFPTCFKMQHKKVFP